MLMLLKIYFVKEGFSITHRDFSRKPSWENGWEFENERQFGWGRDRPVGSGLNK